MNAVTPLLDVRDITKRFTVSRGLGNETAA